MQRTGKLKLKRKTFSKTLSVEADYGTKEDQCFSERIKNNPEDYANCVTLLSSSDEDQPSSIKSNTKTEAPSNKNLQHCGKEVQCQGFLDVADIGVREIRQLVLQSRTRYIPNPLVDLPPFPGQELETKEYSLPRNPRDVLPFKVNSEETLNELSPLPVMCDWCRRRKPVKYDLFGEEIHTKENVFLTGVTTTEKSTDYTAKQPYVRCQDSTNFSHTEKLLETKITGPFVKNGSVSDDLPGNKINNYLHMKMECYDSEFSSDSFDLMEVEEGGYNPSESRTTINQGEDISSVSEMFVERRRITADTSSICKGLDNSTALIDRPLESTGNTNATIQCCPLCQEKFDPSMCQVAIDGHIAVCLAASTDDKLHRTYMNSLWKFQRAERISLFQNMEKEEIESTKDTTELDSSKLYGKWF